MDGQFYNVLISEPNPALGVPLRPLTVGHHAILTALRSPFLHGGAPTLDDCLLAIGICSRSFPEARAWILDPAAMQAEAEKLGSRFGVAAPLRGAELCGGRTERASQKRGYNNSLP